MALSLLPLIACGPDWLGGDDPSGESELLDPGGEAEGKLALDRSEILSEGICGEAAETLTLSNVGDGVLQIDTLELEGEGWALPAVDLPLYLQPGAGHPLELEASPGEAELSIVGPSTAVRVPLSGQPDQPPEISLTSPSSSVLVDVGETLALQAWVSDDQDAPEDLTVRWRSDLDGEVDAYPPQPDGLISAEWVAIQRTPGTHTLSLQVTDTCGNEVELEATICQEGGYALADSGAERFEYAGDALWLPEDEGIRLTPSKPYQTGAAFMTDHRTPAGAVEIEFDFFVGASDGADGFSLTALDADRYTELLGAEGCGLGYGDARTADCIDGANGLPGWSIEVDTYFNPELDQGEADHIAMSLDGDQTSTVFYAELPELEDDTWHTMLVRSFDGHLEVAVDGTTYVDQPLDLDFEAHVGFTAATGGDTNLHMVDKLAVREGYCN